MLMPKLNHRAAAWFGALGVSHRIQLIPQSLRDIRLKHIVDSVRAECAACVDKLGDCLRYCCVCHAASIAQQLFYATTVTFAYGFTPSGTLTTKNRASLRGLLSSQSAWQNLHHASARSGLEKGFDSTFHRRRDVVLE